VTGLSPYLDKIFGNINVDFDVIYQLQINYSVFVRYRRKQVGVKRDNTTGVHRFQAFLTLGREKYCTILSLNLVYL